MLINEYCQVMADKNVLFLAIIIAPLSQKRGRVQEMLSPSECCGACSDSDLAAKRNLEAAADVSLPEWEEDARNSSGQGVQIAQG